MTIQDVPGSSSAEEPVADEIAALLWTPFTRWDFAAEAEDLEEELGPPEPWEDERPTEGDPLVS